ncbi:hypothetical protein CBS101457_005091 [Exobasidium rhododendri]|nr:hypothetical protein CBS101457_005091 [Exobasidium rhododendri]
MSSSSFFQDLMRLRQVSQEPLVYETVSKPVKMGNALVIAYGGFTSAVAVQAAFHSLPDSADNSRSSWAIYSAMGLFLGPTALDRVVHYTVVSLRDTRSFATRFIVGSQDFDGKMRKCLSMTVDFTRKTAEAGPFHNESRLPMSFSLPPTRKYTPPEEHSELKYDLGARMESGEIPLTIKDEFERSFTLSSKVTLSKIVKGDILHETVYGVMKRTDTPYQLATPDVTQRRNADYFKAKDTLTPTLSSSSPADGSLPMSEYALQASYLAFLIDGAIAFYPLVEHGLRLQDAGACSTLDFAVRFHEDELDFYRDYHLREIRTFCASRERTFNEALVWNLDGKLIASVTQQCIARPKKSTARL